MKYILAIRAALWCMVPIWLVFFMPGQIYRAQHDEAERTRVLLGRQADQTRTVLGGQLTAWLTAANARIADGLRRAGQTESDANERSTEALAIMRHLAETLPVIADRQMDRANDSLASVAAGSVALEKRYQTLPDDMRADREYQGLVAETMGVLGATKVTMGEAAKTSKVIAAEAPRISGDIDSMADSGKGIAADAKVEADQLTKPQTKMAQIRGWLLTIARLYGAL